MAHPRSPREWHLGRARRILRDHPEVRSLHGPAPVTALLIGLLVAVQSAAALLAATLPWPLVAAAAWLIGAVPALGLFVLLHEGAHGLIFPSRRTNEWMMVIATAPLLLPWAPGFRHYHLEHHRALGDGQRDVDVPSGWETPLTRTAPGRALWLLAWPILQLCRLGRCPSYRMLNRFFVANLAVNLAFVAPLFALGGSKAVAFCALSLLFAFGLHPLGGRMLQEHVAAPAGQPSCSYYGPGNRLLFNAGFHVEHHDFMGVAWLRLPKVRELAAGHYDGLESFGSWTRLAGRFVRFGRQATVPPARSSASSCAAIPSEPRISSV